MPEVNQFNETYVGLSLFLRISKISIKHYLMENKSNNQVLRNWSSVAKNALSMYNDPSS
jgi:hypothetical protein